MFYGGEVIEEKYSVLEVGWRFKNTKLPYGCRLCRNILKEWKSLMGPFRVNDGSRVHF